MNFKKLNIEKLKKEVTMFSDNTKHKVVANMNKTKKIVNDKLNHMNTGSISLRNVHFNFHHLVSVVMVAMMAFFITFYSTGFNTMDVSAAELTIPEKKAFNKKAIDVNYGDTKAIANVAKEILKDEVSSVKEIETISSSVGTGVYAFDNYMVTVTLDQIELGENTATLTIEDKATYAKSEVEKVVTTESSTDLNRGNVYTYQIALNIIDKDAPVITLSENSVTIKDSDEFDARKYVASVIDNVDANVDFSVEGEVAREDDKYVAGDYTLIIRAKDSSGNEASTELKVVVEKTKEEASNDTTSSTQTYGNYAESAYAGSIVAEARSQIGKAYVYGGSGPNAFDCSGLVQYVYARSGISIPRTSGSQSTVGVAIDPNDVSQWRAGDIVTFGAGGNAHAAIYSGSGTLIHALNPALGVRETGVYGFGVIYAVRRVQ